MRIPATAGRQMKPARETKDEGLRTILGPEIEDRAFGFGRFDGREEDTDLNVQGLSAELSQTS